MGNHKFKFSDMIPNAWFYKLRDMNSTKLRNQSHSYSHQSSFNIHNIKRNSPSPSSTQKPQPRKSSDIRTDDKLICHASNNLKLLDTHFPYTSSRKSTKRRTKRKTVYVPSPRKYPDGVDDLHSSPGNEFFESPSSEFEYSDSLDRRENQVIESSFSDICDCQLFSSAADVIIDVEEKTSHDNQNIRIKRVEEFDLVSELELPPILTKPTKHNSMEKSLSSFTNSPVKNPKVNEAKLEKNRSKKITRTSSPARRSLSRSGKVKVRGKFSGKKSDVHGPNSNARIEKKGLLFYADSFAIVKASFDPEKDFRDSMLEMIVENNIRVSKDLEELLACYLSLNSNQYHDLIIKSFMQIWFNFLDL